MMKLVAYSFLIVVLATLRQVPGLPAAGQEPPSGSSAEPDEIKSPQLLYMKRLHDRLEGTKQLPKMDSKQLDGSLYAISLEAENVTGPGNTSEGFNMQEGNTYNMEFSIPRQKDATDIQAAELWIFPREEIQIQLDFVQMVILVKVELEHAKKPRKEVIDVVWNTRRDCITLNLTNLSKKISRNLEKNELQQATVSLSIELVAVIPRSEVPNDEMEEYFVDLCNALANKQTKTPFLVVKYYQEQPFLLKLPGSGSRSKRAESDSRDCSYVPTIVQLATLFGPNIIWPKQVDIGNCYGTCNALQNTELFSNHARIIEKLKHMEVFPIKRDTSCVPTSYDSLTVIMARHHSLILVSFPEVSVTECGCR